jgi:site-specific DNA-methyltransferase (adenine-specific)/modification methylase
MKRIGDKSIDMILCDLPYGTTQNKWDSVIPLDELWKEYKRIIKDNGVIVLTSQGIFTAKLILSNEKWFKYKLVWEKSKATNFLNAKKQPLRKHEDICVFYNKQPQYNPQMTEGKPYDKGVRKNQLTGSYGDFNPVHVKSEGMRYPTDVVYFKTAESEGKVYHPTQKPVALLEYLIKTYTRENELILDNCMGSGSTGVACLNTNRKFIGIEKDDNYFEIAKKRIEEVRYDVSR